MTRREQLPAQQPAELSAAHREQIDDALRDAKSENTRRLYRSAWRAWCAEQGHVPLPADPLAVAAYLTDRIKAGAAIATVTAARSAIGFAHKRAGVENPAAHAGVLEIVGGLTRAAAGRGRGQADPLTADGLAAIIATATIPRRTGRGLESAEQAQRRGQVDRAIAGLLFQGGMRRSEAAALTWGDVTRAHDGGLLVQVRRSKTNQDGARADVRFLKAGAAAAVWQLRPEDPAADAQVLGGISGKSIARRLAAAAAAAGIEGRITGHSGRVGLAVELTRRGAPTAAVALAGGWQGDQMVIRYAAPVAAEQGAVAKYL